MQKNRIPAIAAALLLLPLSLAGVSGPAAAQPRSAVVAQAALIESFVLRPAGRLKVGDAVRFRVRGASGGRAWVDVPRVASGIALREVRSGIYEGEYTIRRGDALDFSQAVATVQRGRDRHSLRADPRGDDRDWARDGRDAKNRPPAPHALEVTSHKDLAFVNIDKPLTVRGRTSPNALVRVEANFIAVHPERAPTVRTVRADARGDFAATLPAMNPGQASGRVDLVLTSTGSGRPAATQLVKLLHMR